MKSLASLLFVLHFETNANISRDKISSKLPPNVMKFDEFLTGFILFINVKFD